MPHEFCGCSMCSEPRSFSLSDDNAWKEREDKKQWLRDWDKGVKYWRKFFRNDGTKAQNYWDVYAATCPVNLTEVAYGG